RGAMTTAARDPAQKFIVAEGPIGVGKTSLARRLSASVNAETVLEQAAENPFLERFYRNPRAGAGVAIEPLQEGILGRLLQHGFRIHAGGQPTRETGLPHANGALGDNELLSGVSRSSGHGTT